MSFKLIHRFYPVKKFKQKFIADVEPSCSFCLNADETVEHLFWSCQYTQEFWYDIDAFFKLNFLYKMRNIIFGYSDPTKENICFIINFIIFLSKFYNHKCKFSNCKPVFVVFLRDMENYINLISVSNNKKAVKTVRICSALKLLEIMALYCIYYYYYLFFECFLPFYFVVVCSSVMWIFCILYCFCMFLISAIKK